MKRMTFVAAKVLLCWAMLSRAVYAQNAVTDWATIVQPAINTPPKLPAIQMALRAMVQIAVYDAVVAIQGGYRPFAATISAPPDADVRAPSRPPCTSRPGPAWAGHCSMTNMPTTCNKSPTAPRKARV